VIQRLQSLFLLLAAILNLAVFFTPIYRHSMADPAAWIGFGLAGSLTLAMIVGIISIFLYQSRQGQLKWVKIGTYLQVAALAFALGVLFSLGGFGTFLWREVLSAGVILISLILFWQAGRLIRKDEELVRSMDRIR
jgi:hypothetical protein